MALGDLTPRVTGNYQGDHQMLKNSINKMGESVSKILNQVKEAVQATASAANEISSSTEEMAAGAQEQSAQATDCLLYTSPSPRDRTRSRMPSSA